MNDLAERQQTQAPAVAGETGAVLAMIERVATNPEADMDKLERLLDMQERVMNRNAEGAFARAMNEAQAEMGPVAADANNPQTRSRYASYAALDRALRPVYTRHGFSLSFDTGESGPETVKVLCHVSHSEGHTRTYQVVMPADGKGAKGGDVMTKTHAAGAGMSYGMRYLLKLIFNVAVGEDDNDGNPQPIGLSAKQVEQLRNAARVAGVDEDYVCKKAHVERLQDIHPSRLKAALNHLKAKAQGAQS